ncbi:DUF2231 domain-containing protein [Falsibacillus albus]|uniref:DUF2231 domain-containing protein n=1 Tax=Falsibacillus albus TaxID=2478915 RepID=A0A3L7JV25_9BACI|nr:DUF2231 domain-containing protein [Falsibacillus albus]RLQ94094.1 hypothetical protein D9X91_15810 [Falsibacillus albus]
MLSTPLHPLLVHFPIALLIFGTIAQIIALWRKEFFDKAATYLIGSGFVTGLFSYWTGDDAEHFAFEHWGRGLRSLIHTHETYALVTLILFGVAFAIKLLLLFMHKPFKMAIPLVIVLSLAGTTTLALTGHYGGKIVYSDHNQNGAPTTDSNE